jgi:hypothetical protein
MKIGVKGFISGLVLGTIGLFIVSCLPTLGSTTLRAAQGGDRLDWDIPASSGVSLADARDPAKYEYRLYRVGEVSFIALTGVACTQNAAVITCSATRPAAIARGTNVQITWFRRQDGNESPKSDPCLIPLAALPKLENLRYVG